MQIQYIAENGGGSGNIGKRNCRGDACSLCCANPCKRKADCNIIAKDPKDYLVKLNSKLAGGVIDPYAVMKARSISDWVSMCALVHPLHNELRMKLQIGESDLMGTASEDLPWQINFISPSDFVSETDERSNDAKIIPITKYTIIP